jgi:Domain of unknown function (DUF4129)
MAKAGPAPRTQAVLPATLAAAAEAGILFLPIEAVARNTPLHPTGGPFAWYPLFLALFAGGAAAAMPWRGRRRMPAVAAVVAAAVGVVQVAVWGDGWAGLPYAVALALGACVRVVTLVMRDWRDPVDASFGWGAGILLGEIAFARVAGWGGEVLAPIVAVFFVGSLASRAASVRLAEAAAPVPDDVDGEGPRRRWRVLAAVVVAAAVLVPLGLLLGTSGGPMAGISRWLFHGLVYLIYLGALLLALLLRPVVWFLHLFGVDAGGFRKGIERLGLRLRHLGPQGTSSSTVPAWERLLGLLGLAAIVAGLVWFMVRRRQRARRAMADLSARDRPDDVIVRRERPPRARRRPRRELPEDSVRRLYAQALIELEKRGRPRPDALTPGEFLRHTARDLPECAPGLTVLTRAYEDVRYGRLVIDGAKVDSLEAEWLVLSKAIREAPPPAPEDEEAQPDEPERFEGADRSAPSTDATFGRR